jgi:hypothetical protein
MDATTPPAPPKKSEKPSGPAPGSFVITHCRKCALGWTRTLEGGGVTTVCLLDRDPVPYDLKDCDQYDPYEEKKPEAA